MLGRKWKPQVGLRSQMERVDTRIRMAEAEVVLMDLEHTNQKGWTSLPDCTVRRQLEQLKVLTRSGQLKCSVSQP